MNGKVGNPGLKGRLLENSIEAYILALETINRLSIKYRVETFAYLICNAWELLVKAKILQDTKQKKAIYYKQKNNNFPRSITLRDCLNKTFPNEKDPIRRNIEMIAELRDQCVHLVISQVPKDILAIFQSCVLNYHSSLTKWFKISLSERVSVGMMTIVYDFNPEQFDLNNVLLRRQLGRDTAHYLMKFQAAVRQESELLGKPSEFSVDFSYKLALVKGTKNADINLTKGEGGKVTQIVEVPKDPGKTHPYRQVDVLAQVNASLSKTKKINNHDIQCIAKIFDIKKRSEFYYQGTVKGSPGQYSQDFIEWLLEQYSDDNNFFTHMRQKAKKN